MAPVPASEIAKKTLAARIKSWGWRITAIYVWLHSILMIANGRDMLAGLEHATTIRLAGLLSSVGFTPTNADHLPLVLGGIWLLAITGFSLPQLFVGFPLYVIFFPFTVLLVLVYRKVLKGASPATNQQDAIALSKQPRGFPLASLTISLLLGWLVLYGGSTSRGPSVVGCVISGILFLTLAYRALDKTSPIDERDTIVFSRWAVMGILITRNASQSAIDSPPKTKFLVDSGLRTTGLFMCPFRYVTKWFRGRRGRDKVAMMMLVEYIVFLVILAVSAILFWALAMKAAPAEATLSLGTALRISASHFFPGISPPSLTTLPWWAEFGPALTSWVLFVVYIGAVGSALPGRQQEFVERLTPIQGAFRKSVKLWHVYRRFMKSQRKNCEK